MKNEYYEDTYNKNNHFSFGKNWEQFLKTIDKEKILEAEKSLEDFLGKDYLRDKTFVDVGSGSGLFSLAAFKLKTKQVASIDIDDFSIACTNHLKEKSGNPQNWIVAKGSALDDTLKEKFGTFDIVYSWGVLHHTGDMYKAIDNTCKLVAPGGIFFLAIYNKNTSHWREGTSKLWLKIKRAYNSASQPIKLLYLYLFISYYFIGSLLLFKNPYKYIRDYKSSRGMSWYHDRIDWIGGYPYEFASPDEIVNFAGERGFLCKKIKYRDGIGCSEYLLVKQ